MSEKLAIRKLLDAGFSDSEIKDLLYFRWYRVFKTMKKLAEAGNTREEINELFSLRRKRPDQLTGILREERERKRVLQEQGERKREEPSALLNRQKERYASASSPITSEPPRFHNPLDPFGRGRW